MSWAEVPFNAGEDRAEIRRRAAELWAKYPTIELAVLLMQVLPGEDNTGRCFQYARDWAIDLDFLDIVDDYRRNTVRKSDGVPDREELAAELIALARNPATYTDEKVKAYKVAAEI